MADTKPAVGIGAGHHPKSYFSLLRDRFRARPDFKVSYILALAYNVLLSEGVEDIQFIHVHLAVLFFLLVIMVHGIYHELCSCACLIPCWMQI